MGCRLLVLAALVLVVGTALVPGAAAKGRKHSCRGTKVAVKAGKKTTCLPFAKVFPPPKEIDLQAGRDQAGPEIRPGECGQEGKKRKQIKKPRQSSFRDRGEETAQAKLIEGRP